MKAFEPAMPVRAAIKDTSDGRMRLTVLGGFLGSGKTTWLRHQLHHGLLADAFVVVNEAAETAIDDALLGRSAELAVLAGGCACCDALGDLITLLRAICDARVSRAKGAAPLDQIVLETSGLADPGPIVAALRADPVLIHHIVVCEIVVAVDAVYGMRQIRQEPLCRRQMELADRVIVTKIDEAEADHVASLLATLRRINPAATISGAVKGSEVMLPHYEGVAAETLPDLGDAPAGLPILALKLTIGDDIDWTAFSVWLSALIHARGDDILRVKGVVRTPAGRLLLQSVRKIVQSPEILPNEDDRHIGEDNSVIFIGRGFSAENLSRSLRHFAGIRS
jgi:G3E family GTPase